MTIWPYWLCLLDRISRRITWSCLTRLSFLVARSLTWPVLRSFDFTLSKSVNERETRYVNTKSFTSSRINCQIWAHIWIFECLPPSLSEPPTRQKNKEKAHHRAIRKLISVSLSPSPPSSKFRKLNVFSPLFSPYPIQTVNFCALLLMGAK